MGYFSEMTRLIDVNDEIQRNVNSPFTSNVTSIVLLWSAF
jgi:hypothetical protein